MKPVRLPLKFDEAVSDLLKVKPPEKGKDCRYKKTARLEAGR
jgi:hypothetical protein